MAMKAMKGAKRAASPVKPASPAKKGRGAGCREVIKALKEVGPWSPAANIVTMLCDAVPHTLGVPKEDRHAFQEKIVGWTEQTLAAYAAGMQKEANELAAKVADSDGEKAARDAAKAAKDGELEKLREAVAAARTALAECETAKTLAAASLAATEQAQIEGDAEYEKAAKTKAEIELTHTEAYVPLKAERTEELPEMSNQMARLLQLGKDFSFDEALLTSFPSALRKEPSARGTFDQMVLEQYEQALQERVAALAKVLSEGQAGKDARAAAVAAAQAVSDSACTALTAAKDALAGAKEAKTAGDAALKEAQRSVKDFVPEMKAIASLSDAAAARLQAFQDGPLAGFAALKDPPPPPVEEPAEVAPAASAPAEAVPAAAA